MAPLVTTKYSTLDHQGCQSVPTMDANQCPQWASLIGMHYCLALIGIHQYHTLQYISATYQCPSMPPISAHLCHLSVPISATYQCP